MYVTPEALRYAAGYVDKEWGSSGYAITRIEGSGHICAVLVAHFDGSRFWIAANDLTGAWASAEGEDDQALTVALYRMEHAKYVGGAWILPASVTA